MKEVVPLLISACELGFIYALVTLGVHLSSRVARFDDFTLEGSFSLGGALTVYYIKLGYPCFITMAFVVLAGMAAGMLTATIYRYLRISPLICGLVVTTGLFSFNLYFAGSHQSLAHHATLFSLFEVHPVVILLAVIAALFSFLYWFSLTEWGLLLKASGDNKQFVTNLGHSHHFMTLISLAIANGCSALSGSLFVQWSFFIIRVNAFELKNCSIIAYRSGYIHFRCDVVSEAHEQGMYKEWLHCSLSHPQASAFRYKVIGVVEKRYIPSFKQQRSLYKIPCTIIASCKMKPEEYDESPLFLTVSAIVLTTSGVQHSCVRVSRFKGKELIKFDKLQAAEHSNNKVALDKQIELPKQAFDFQYYWRQLWEWYRLFWYCLWVLLCALICMKVGGYAICLTTLYCCFLAGLVFMVPFIAWHQQSLISLISMIFLLGVASVYALLTGIDKKKGSQVKRIFGRMCAAGIIPLILYWYVSTTIETPLFDSAYKVRQKGE